jgi:hypothetical protein
MHIASALPCSCGGTSDKTLREQIVAVLLSSAGVKVVCLLLHSIDRCLTLAFPSSDKNVK